VALTSRGWDHVRDVLCIRLDGLGDVLMTTPAIRAVAGERARRVTVLASSGGAPIARLVPEIAEVVTYDAPWIKSSPTPADPGLDHAMIDALRVRSFDAAVVFTVSTQTAAPALMLAHLAQIPLRLAHVRERVYGLATDGVVEPEPDRLVRHEVRRQLDLVRTVGWTTRDERLSLRVGEPARERVGQLLEEAGIGPGTTWALLHPGATAPSRRYPAESYALAADLLMRDGIAVALSGGPSDAEAVQAVRRGMRHDPFVLPDALNVEELAAAVAAAPVLITNNTGPAHIAAAMGTPVVDVYALTNPQHTPWRVPSRVLFQDVPCRGCLASVCPQGHHRCLVGVPPVAVAEAARQLLRDAARPSPLRPAGAAA
jgi:ADP-heptose:LPS heptosyltransferase